MSIITMPRRSAHRTEETVRLYTVVEAASRLGVSADYIYERQKDRSLRAVDIGTNGRKKIRVRADDLQDYIEARTA